MNDYVCIGDDEYEEYNEDDYDEDRRDIHGNDITRGGNIRHGDSSQDLTSVTGNNETSMISTNI
jgi:hypothetical protein